MNIKKVTENKRDYWELLLLADEQEEMVEKYLDTGDMYILEDDGVVAECVVVRLSPGEYELKNIATDPKAQRRGYGRKLIEFVKSAYPDMHTLFVGTGDSPLTIPFYESCGFCRDHIIKDFFTKNYDHPIIEAGVQLRDMVYLKWTK